MKNYYFLAIRLPPLAIGEVPEITFRELTVLLEDNLSSDDLHKTKVIRLYYDIENVLSYWKEEELDLYGNCDYNQLEEAIVDESRLPAYVLAYLQQYETDEERLKNFVQLIHAYFRNEIAASSGFLRQYLEFERKWRLVFLGFRAKQLKRDVAKELQYEDPEDPLVLQILAQKDAPQYEPPEGFEELKDIFEAYSQKPYELHKALYEYRFNKIDNMLGFDMFSINRILGYMIQLIMVEKWISLDKTKGVSIVNSILKEAS